MKNKNSYIVVLLLVLIIVSLFVSLKTKIYEGLDPVNKQNDEKNKQAIASIAANVQQQIKLLSPTPNRTPTRTPTQTPTRTPTPTPGRTTMSRVTQQPYTVTIDVNGTSNTFKFTPEMYNALKTIETILNGTKKLSGTGDDYNEYNIYFTLIKPTTQTGTPITNYVPPVFRNASAPYSYNDVIQVIYGYAKSMSPNTGQIPLEPLVKECVIAYTVFLCKLLENIKYILDNDTSDKKGKIVFSKIIQTYAYNYFEEMRDSLDRKVNIPNQFALQPDESCAMFENTIDFTQSCLLFMTTKHFGAWADTDYVVQFSFLRGTRSILNDPENGVLHSLKRRLDEISRVNPIEIKTQCYEKPYFLEKLPLLIDPSDSKQTLKFNEYQNINYQIPPDRNNPPKNYCYRQQIFPNNIPILI